MNKADLITRLALMVDGDPLLREVAAVLNGSERAKPAEARMGLKAVAAQVGKHPTWLWKIGVTGACGERIGGRLSYRHSQVIDYLKSEACRVRIAELAFERKKRDAVRRAQRDHA